MRGGRCCNPASHPFDRPVSASAYGFPDAAIQHILADGKFTAESVATAQYWLPCMEADPSLLCPDAARYRDGQKITIIRVRCFRTIAAIGTEDML